MFIHADKISLTLFCVFTAVMAGVMWFALGRTKSRIKWASVVAGLALVASGLAYSGLTLKYVIPVLPL